jgi:hypothetical protein
MICRWLYRALYMDDDHFLVLLIGFYRYLSTILEAIHLWIQDRTQDRIQVTAEQPSAHSHFHVMSPSQYFSVVLPSQHSALHARGHDAASGADHDHPHWMHEYLVPDPYYVFDLGLPFDSPHLVPHVVVTLSSPAPFEILNDFEFAIPEGLPYRALPEVAALPGPVSFETGHDPPEDSPS